ncbi:lipoprotein-releasing ABC transporter permease subunit [Testudinibacter sp. TR-2022]|uniref:lipoprotein-releasing ABC transporter permease subunit n=1 Tax=Testudinibacter sp. TR-2022 TaxID=2585029 RepID=UPI00111AA048|nr:lipoprotein-releasing ABC transporter permease subunit [Testudinibacter sp. TR-2022]TNH04438.1 lipoprotein-releasing ABC transporter permease subunit [Pasteurellaceae bacterium Phil31]TNH06072.1 lipoprotein-releasing ABC transporter permease subunit [Testudinibacter sp. TR-2022]TNH07761.1 lipoprotein-releasing ABC transporter permease subunit [Testudinibacter sp. TR-2022]TNH14425.1 lipoprotein-releasing ABC transporter permease subunit [Testudinibacter sp. TR-2022]TNH17386.1 lipoprotein-rel
MVRFRSVPLFIAWRYWRSKSADRFGRVVTWLGSIGIVLGVMALVIVLSVMNGLQQQQKDNVLSTLPHAVIQPLDRNLAADFRFSQLPPFVQSAVGINNSDVILQSATGIGAARIIGVFDSSDDPALAWDELDLPQLLAPSDYHILIGAALANELKLQVGDKVRVMLAANSQYTPFGRVPVQRLFSVAAVLHGDSSSDQRQVYANIQDVGRLLRIPPNEVQGVRLFLDDPFKITELPDYFPPSEWKIADWREQKGEFFQAVAMEKNMMGLLIGLIIVVAIANIVTSLSLMVLDKQGEIAILQTQGMKKRQVMQIFIFQGLLVGVIGTWLGCGLGWLLAEYINPIIGVFNPSAVALPVLFDGTQLALIVIATLGLTLLSTLYPAYRAAKIEPADALRYE